MKRLFVSSGQLLALALPAPAFARGEFDPTTEFEQHEWVSIHLGPLNMSITKAVAYLLIGTALTILLGLVLMRGKTLNRRQTVGEAIYEIAQVQVAEQGLPGKAIGRWFPVRRLADALHPGNQSDRLHPAATHRRDVARRPGLGNLRRHLIAIGDPCPCSADLRVHAFEGIRWNGPVRYFKSWIPEAPKALLALIVPLEILGQFMRLISLSVRLFANMLAGHILILTFIGLIFILESIVLAPFVIIVGSVFYIFEVVIVVSIQAFIFAALSAIYIGSAIEPEH